MVLIGSLRTKEHNCGRDVAHYIQSPAISDNHVSHGWSRRTRKISTLHITKWKNISFCLMNCTIRWKAMLLQCLRKKVRQTLWNDQNLSPCSMSGHLLQKLPQFWPVNRKATLQMGSTVPILSSHLWKMVKINPYYYCCYYLNPEPWVQKLYESFWIQISGLFAD